jgi:ABC-type transporter Mla subunit MlaD
VLANLDQLGASTAPDAQSNADAITNLARTTAILAQQSGRFNDLLASLDSLSTQGRAILQSYLPQMNDQLRGLAALTSAIAHSQQDLALVLHYLPGHNKTVALATFQRFVQVLEDIVVCGVPGGGDTNTAVGSCHTGAGG